MFQAKTVSNKCMETQEFCLDLFFSLNFLMSKNSILASEILSNDHLIGYSRHLKKNNSILNQRMFQSVNIKPHTPLTLKFCGRGYPFLTSNLMPNNHMI